MNRFLRFFGRGLIAGLAVVIALAATRCASAAGNAVLTGFDNPLVDFPSNAPASGMPQFTTLVDFAGSNGANPRAALVAGPGGDLYGTTADGGTSGSGTVFKITPSGMLTTLYTFSATNGNFENGDGADPFAALIVGPGGDLYGSTIDGGTSGSGTVFKITPSGMLTTLYTFSALDSDFENGDGANPRAALVVGPGGDLYGSTIDGGTSGSGTVFKITPSGMLTTLYTFSATNGFGENSNGANPRYALVVGPGGDLYGSTIDGGTSGSGTVFKITPSGMLTTLYTFSATNGNFENSDGAIPFAALVFGPDNNFYGTTFQGGLSGYGTVFKITPSGMLTTLYAFSALDSDFENGDGANPRAALVVGPGGDLYGTAPNGGSSGSGTVFKITPSGMLTTLYAFSALDSDFENGDGADPYAALVAGPDGNFYGTTNQGGTQGNGTVFRIALPPTIKSFTPGKGPVGSVVTLTGTSLSGVTAVRFHDASAKVFTANADGTQLTVIVPRGARNGTITVTTPSGSVKTTRPFRVTHAPIIVSFLPASGSVDTVVTITGLHLGGITRVRFHNADATVYSSNAEGTQLTVIVPSGAATGTIKLNNQDVLKTTSTGAFTVTP